MILHRFKDDTFKPFNDKFSPEKLKEIESHDQLKDILIYLLNDSLAPILEKCQIMNVTDPFVSIPNTCISRSDIYFKCSNIETSIPIIEIKTIKVLMGGGLF